MPQDKGVNDKIRGSCSITSRMQVSQSAAIFNGQGYEQNYCEQCTPGLNITRSSSSSSGLNPNVIGVAGADLPPPLASVPCLTFTDSSLFHVFLYTVFPSSSWPTSLLSSHLHSSYPLTHIFITSSHYMSKPPQSSFLQP